jgi:hypothetical protein
MKDPSSRDARLQALVSFLVEAAPVLRERIRDLRGPQHPLLSTSDLHAAVVHRMVEDEAGPNTARNLGETTGTHADSISDSGDARHRWTSLMTVAQRTVSDALALVERAAGLPTPAAQEEFRGAAGEDQAAIRARVDSLLAWLDPVDRHLLQLRVRGMSWRAIAATTDLDEATCRQRWVRLLKELRIRMGN